MSKKDIIEAIVKKVGCTKKCATLSLKVILDEIIKSLTKGKKVVLTGFGTFKVIKVKARAGTNPRTGEKIKISARKLPKFKAGEFLKKAVKK